MRGPHAGLRSGNLASALEGYCDAATRMAELRRVVGLATLYPLFLLVAAWCFFLLISSVAFPSSDWLDIGDETIRARVNNHIE